MPDTQNNNEEKTYDSLSDEEKYRLDSLLTMIINKYVDDQMDEQVKTESL